MQSFSRRAGMLSLIVAMIALAGASVPPTRGLAGRSTTAIVWQARTSSEARVRRDACQRHVIVATRRAAPLTVAGVRPSSVLLDHALFQRPPPAAAIL